MTQQTSNLYSSLVHILLSKLGVSEVTTALICPACSSKVVANGGMYTTPLLYLWRKKNKGS